MSETEILDRSARGLVRDMVPDRPPRLTRCTTFYEERNRGYCTRSWSKRNDR